MARILSLPRTLALTGLTLGFAHHLSQAAPMSADQVRAMTGGWLTTQAELAGRRIEQLRPLSWEAAEPAFYLASLEGAGWVLAGGDDALLPVIGWSDQPLPQGELPPALVEWLKAAEQDLLALRAQGARSEPARQAWQDLTHGASATPLLTDPSDVLPLIEAHWNQGVTYNELCPTDAAGPGDHVWVGCVAVAMAQVMDFWNWPQQGQSAQSYVHAVYGTISVDYSQAFYNWSLIDPAVPAGDDVRQLLYHSGVAVRMNYGPGISTAQSSMIVTAMRSFFRYQDTAHMVWRSAYSAADWRDLLHAELAAGRPVIYRGQGPAGGHAFDVDGVQDSTWFHINWGWSGNYDGWFELTDLSPGNFTFNDVQGAIVGIAPVGVAVNHAPVVPSLFLQGQLNQTISATLIGYDVDGDTLDFRVDGQPLDGNVWTWTPPLNASGTWTHTYQACDNGGCSAPASIVVVISGGNQVPVVSSVSVESLENDWVGVALAGSDPEGDAITYRVDGQTIEGDTWHWLPPANAHGTFSFLYTACDAGGCGNTATLTVAVQDVNQAPIVAPMTVEGLEDEALVLTLAGFDADGDALTYLVDGSSVAGDLFSWTPEPGASGVFTFSYQACDGALCSETASLSVHILAVNDLPQVSPVFTHLPAAGLQHVQLVAWDLDHDSLTYVIDGVAQASDIFTVQVDDENSQMSFHYFVTDGQAVSDTVAIELTLAPKSAPKQMPIDLPNLGPVQPGDGLALDAPAATRLQPAYPNPFNPATTLSFDLAETAHVRLMVCNIAGQQVAVLVDGLTGPGSHRVRWDASRLASGAYLAVLQTPAGLQTQILQLVK